MSVLWHLGITLFKNSYFVTFSGFIFSSLVFVIKFLHFIHKFGQMHNVHKIHVFHVVF